MDKIEMTIWGRKINLNIVFECWGEQKPTKSQEEALDHFSEEIPNKALSNVKQYCLQDENMTDEKEIPNIYKYVVPNTIYIMRDTNNHKVALLCDYRFDDEHGLAIVFENEFFKDIVSQSDL